MISLSSALVCLAAGAAAAAFFSGAEMAILSMDPAVLRKRVRDNPRASMMLERFFQNPQRFLTAALAGSALSLSLAAAPLSLYLLERGELPALLSGLALLFFVYLFFGSVLPKILFHVQAETLVLPSLFALRFFIYLFYPLILVVSGFAWALEKVLGGEGKGRGFWYTRDELKLLLANHSSAASPDPESQQMIDRIFEFSETLVMEVMVPLVEVEAVSEDASAGEALRLASRHLYSRYPVFRDRTDNLVGFIYAADLLEAESLEEPITPWIKPVNYIPYNMPVDELLFNMQEQGFDFAVVVDEYGGCAGIITREDIIEEIVGEIEDEHDEPVILYRRLDQRRVLVNGRMEVDEINEVLGWNLPEGEYETLAGFLLFLFKRVPKPGERIRYKNLVFTIKEATDRAIHEVLVEEAEPSPSRGRGA